MLGRVRKLTPSTERVQTLGHCPWIRSVALLSFSCPNTDASQGTEGSVGAVIREPGIPREQIFVTTKLPYVDPFQKFLTDLLSIFMTAQLAPSGPGQRVNRRKFG
ncbi:hypothetical protein J3R82DRAFT_10435 [Butyriboletus roseoflavus]|nr:hypothetical protein J3R82DRAFT_10435 [Butyriboletus roseoflavus]